MRTSAQSAHSLEPSEGEPEESFHVRSTYAQLDMSGVKGDGIEEGVERTRARIGRNRASEIRAEAAIDDGSEKKRDLTQQEVELLASLDRYVTRATLPVTAHILLIDMGSSPHLRMTG
jgi:USP6 N-terminal-like protein